MKKVILIFLCALLCACARPTPSPLAPTDADALWQKMASFKSPETYKEQFSLRFGSEGDTRRVTGLLWGDSQRVRLDVMAGVGAPIAKIMAQGDNFLLYLPQKQTAYTHTGSASPWFKMGVPIPLDLKKLAWLMNGDFGAVFQPSGAARASNGDFIYPVDGPLSGELTVNTNGQPLSWKAASGRWTLQANYDGPERQPRSLRLTNLNGKKAIILIKERESDPQFTAVQLELSLPAGTRQESLADLKQGKLQF